VSIPLKGAKTLSFKWSKIRKNDKVDEVFFLGVGKLIFGWDETFYSSSAAPFFQTPQPLFFAILLSAHLTAFVV